MDKKSRILLILLLFIPGNALLAGTGNVSDGLLSSLVLLGFLLFLLGMVHLTELIKIRIRSFFDGIDISDLFGI
jgi:hypothetical protein